MHLLTAAQMRAVETAAIDSGAVTGLELMERAGRGVVAAIFDAWPKMAQGAHRAVVLCGPGNNGGDGFVVARLLHQRGWTVEVALLGDPARMPPDARTNYDRWRALGPVGGWPATGAQADLRIDALFGTGLARAFAAQDVPAPCRVAVDIPSGLCADSGRVLGTALPSDLTVTFHAPKLGHMLAAGPDVCGRVVVADIGLGPQTAPDAGAARAITAPTALLGKGMGHKFTHGHALVLTGGMGRTGAARLAARAALRVGAGLVTLGAPGAALLECACQVSALMLRRIDTAQALTETAQDARITALCLGPGLGLARARDLVPAALALDRAVVLDADALSAYQDAPETLFAMLRPGCVLTPHGGEFARLFPDLADRLATPPNKGPAYSKVEATRAAAKRAGCVVLFKGPDTVLASPDGAASIHTAAYDRAAPWLATAGAGDVLAGMIAGLMARGIAPLQAAESAAWLHVEAARSFGPGLIAEDLPEVLPRVLRSL